MTSIDKSKTSLTKFEDFFSTKYKDKILKVLENYPDERSLLVDFMELTIFDLDLADLLIEKPMDVLLASEKAIKNIYPLMKDIDLNVRFNYITNSVQFKNLNAKYVGKLVSIDGFITSIGKPEPKIDIGVFECKGCMRLHEVSQYSNNSIIYPSLCTECGGRSFRLLHEESEYLDSQCLIVRSEDTSRRLNIILEDDLADYDKYNVGSAVRVTGVLKTLKKAKNKFEEFLLVNHIEELSEDEKPSIDIDDFISNEDNRDSTEYKGWVNNVLSRDDSTCIVCGEKRAPHTHHVFGYKKHPDYRLNVDNGVVLCRWCHHKYHDVFGKDSANPVTFIKFLKGDY